LFATRVSHPLISKLKSTHILENGKYFSQSKHDLKFCYYGREGINKLQMRSVLGLAIIIFKPVDFLLLCLAVGQLQKI
jgi:hypothetical protein